MKNGYGLIEILISTGIITAVFIGFSSATVNSMKATISSANNIKTSFLLEESVEALRSVRDANWEDIEDLQENTDYMIEFSQNSWLINEGRENIDNFQRWFEVSNVIRDDTTDNISSTGYADDGTFLIEVKVLWIEDGQNKERSMEFYIYDIATD